eukprot:Skav220072  [mRNA]  locus=scaffold262:145427:146912:+ [translate_table: standard]
MGAQDAFLQLPEAMELPEPEAKEPRILETKTDQTDQWDFAADESDDEEPPKLVEPIAETPWHFWVSYGELWRIEDRSQLHRVQAPPEPVEASDSSPKAWDVGVGP